MVKKRIDNETSDEKFIRIATSRTVTIIDKIRILSNCANTRVYRYNEDQVNKIFKRLNREIKSAEQKFKEGLLKQKKENFTL